MAEVNFLVKKGLTVPKGSAATPAVIFDASDPDTGLYSPGANQLAISTNGAQALYINADGDILVADGNRMEIDEIRARDGAGLKLYDDAGAGIFIQDGGNVGLGTSSPLAEFQIKATTDVNLGITNSGTRASISCFNDSGSANIPLQIVSSESKFVIGNNDAMIIDSSGNLGVGTASPSYQLELSADSAGKPSTNTWTIVSDLRIKDDIELADIDLCYQAVKDIPLKRFKWKDEVYTEEQVPDRHKLGWIAQDVELVFPKAVTKKEFTYGPEENKTTIPECRDLNADQLYAAMYGAIQKLIDKVEDLEAQLASLKS